MAARRAGTGRAVSPLDAARRAVQPADMPMPEDIPDRPQFWADVAAAVRAECAEEAGHGQPDFHRTMAAIKASLPAARGVEAGRIHFMIDTGQACDIDSHDHFFRIRRSATNAAAAFLSSQIQTLHILATELKSAPTSLAPERLQGLAGALRGTIAFAVGSNAVGPTALTVRTYALGQNEADCSGGRWVRGHQIFAGLCQSLVFVFKALKRAEVDGDGETARQTGELVCVLLTASATALELTGDFPAARYNASIRVSMDAPYFPTGFSGVLSRDHRELVSRMKMMRPAIESLQRRDPDLHARIGASLSAVYASHKHVCARFVAPEATSLLMAATAERPATEQIDRFRKMRLRAWETEKGDVQSANAAE
ncbi:hypothetical protein [Rhizobium sp. SL86]|uniref:hypothetical protein n=1 Tax=Rhizobium sp. SL86 TaxID=2995148 RepID=UPI0022734E85|nr:hypothetical protein [Rhizobium sp. SL86]MCY1667614.1 hypothetical protein [Rhizobium sp. SL86]